MGWYFIAVTLAFMLQQSAVMEGRYKKLWEGVAIGAFLNVLAGSKRYKSWKERQWQSENELEPRAASRAVSSTTLAGAPIDPGEIVS
jgi:hypothetical protein